MGTDEFNRKAYDQRLIRFPKGFVDRFHALFGDVSFNSWVVNIAVIELVQYEKRFSKT